jgi:hypothetical protein
MAAFRQVRDAIREKLVPLVEERHHKKDNKPLGSFA